MLIDEILRQYPVTVFDAPQFAEIFKEFCTGTRFHGHCVVNAPVVPGDLGIFFCRFSSDGLLKMFCNNCAYFPAADDRHMILCDVEFLTRYTNALADPGDPAGIGTAIWPAPGRFAPEDPARFDAMFPALFRSNLIHFFPRWVIGHEVGHAALGHHRALRAATADGVAQRHSKTRETAADLFVIDRMATDEVTRINVFSAITHLLNDWILAETGKGSVIIGDRKYAGPKVKISDLSPTHPPFIIRLLDLMDAFLDRFPNTDTTGFHKRLRRQIQVIPYRLS